jgi:predicted chitinase
MFDATALAASMPSLSIDRAEQLAPGARSALVLAECTTPLRAAMFLAQVGHESVSLQYTEEIASGAAYEGRLDLGNTQPGDGVRFKGRSFIQITGRHNYGLFSKWAYEQGFANTPTYFVDNPTALASDGWAWMGAVWYWTVARPTLNSLADRGDLEGCTYLINGGLNGLEDRRFRYARCLDVAEQVDVINAPPQEDDAMKPYIVRDGAGKFWCVRADLSSRTEVAPDAVDDLKATGQYYDKSLALGNATLARIPVAK